MKILHIMNWFIDNLGYQENYLPFYQAGLGNEVLALCSKSFPRKLRFVKNSSTDIYYDDRVLKIKRLKSLSIKFIAEQNWYFNFKNEVSDFNPDTVHLHNIWDLPSIQFLVTNFNSKKRAKIFVDNHIDNGNFEYKKIHKFIYYFWFIKKIIIPLMLRRDFIFISVNPYSQYCLNSYFDIPPDKINFLPLGIDDERIFFSQEAREKIRNRYSINDKTIVFVFSGAFEQKKMLSVLVTAFKILTEKYDHISLLLIGKGDLPVNREFNLLQEKGRIILAGWQPISELYQWYSASDVGVLPGKLGGTKDILASARPLIVNNELAVSYLIEYNNGLVFKHGDVESLICVMEEYIKNPDLIQGHGKNSLRLVKEKLSWKNIAQKSLQIYNE